MSETYPERNSRNAFRGTYSLQRRNRLQNYKLFFILANIYTQNPPHMSENINGGYHIYLEIKLPSTRFLGSSAPRFARRYNPWLPLLQHRFDTNLHRVPILHLSR